VLKYFIKILIPVWFFTSFAVSDPAECWIETVNNDTMYTVGDTVNLRILLNTFTDTLIAYGFYLTFDSDVFEPLFNEYSVPFTPFDLGQGWSHIINQANCVDSECDEYGISENGIPGFQLDYVRLGSNSSAINGEGIVAFFSLLVRDIPNTEEQSTDIVFDYGLNGRDSHYILREDSTFVENQFDPMTPITIFVEGYSIYPAISDTLVLPGDTLKIDLDDHFQSNEYLAENAVWAVQIIDTTFNEYDMEFQAELTIDSETNVLSIITTENDHALLMIDISLHVEGHNLFSMQNWEVEINHPLRFVGELPPINVLEDDTLYLPTDMLFIDEDDTGLEITLWDTIITSQIDGSSTPVYLSYLSNDTVMIYSEPDWNGLSNNRLFVSESLGRTINTVLTIVVVNVNDPPVIDFSGISGDPALEDTLILYHNTPDTVDLMAFVADIDDNIFSWTIDENNLVDATLQLNNELTLFAPVGVLVNTQLIVHIDDSDTTVSSLININIRSVPPQILLSEPFLVHADTLFSLSLDSVAIFDEDTPFSSLVWDFVFLTPARTPDDNIVFTYDQGYQSLTINSSHSENSEGIVVITVREDFNFGHVVTKELPMVYFASNAPQILTPATIFIFPDTLIAAYTLDTLVFDYNDPPDSIAWTLEGGADLDSVYIDSLDNVLYIQTDNNFFGEDTLTLTATNTLALADTSEIVVKVIPYDPYPQISSLPDRTVYWHSESSYLFDLDDYIFDSSTPVQNIEWSVIYTVDSIDVSINDAHQVLITSSDITGTVSIIFTAENDVGYASSDTMTVLIVQDEPPNWEHLLNIEMSRFIPNHTLSYRLSDRCEDDLTSSTDLVFGVETDTTILKIVLDLQTNVMLELQDTSMVDTTTSLTFYAEDENFNISTSDTVTLTIINGFAPEWGSPSVITFGNDTTYMSECLEEWCEDPDTPDSLLTFIVESTSQDLYAEVIDGPGCSSLWLVPLSEIQGTYFLILRVEDIQGNISSKLVTVTISDQILPSADLSYFITPELNRRLHFILTSDGTVENYNSVPNTFYLDDSLMNSLSFSLIDQQVDLQVWNAPFQFKESGLYKLIVNLTDESDNITIDSLILSVNLPNGEGGTLKSPSGKLSIQYPEYFGNENTVIILNELNRFETIPVDTEETIYAIKSNKLSDIALIISYSGDTYGSDYFSFYQMINGNNIPLTTFLDDDGIFQSSVPLNSEFYFGKSTKPAEKISIPQNDFLCYPNPFNSKISFFLFISNKEEVNLSVYDITGKRVFDKISVLNPGFRKITWDGVDNNSTILPTGIYLVRLSVGEKLFTKKITILK
jgi:hypothetical protein